MSKIGTLSSLLIFLAFYFPSSNLYSQNITGEKTSDYVIPKLLENQVINQNEKPQGTNIRASSIVFSNNVTYNFTGLQQSFVVPCGVTQIYVTIAGAEGGTGAIGGNVSSGGVGGKGSVIKGYLNVTRVKH
ncbi:MAG: hypothetical protein IPO04_17995 [Cytophagaceae bacterium]|nr:hypothetical protein [Cytophagaceae bacterium]